MKKYSSSPFLHKKGSALEDGSAHQRDHQLWSRRSFLSGMGITGAASMLLGNFHLQSLTAAHLTHVLGQAQTDRILVLIQLKGGNDGINTTIPLYDYDHYRNLRPRIAWQENELIPLSDEIGIQPGMGQMEQLWKEGWMKIVHNVGYPDQNLSHFRSTDIWTTASDADEFVSDGWLGRYIDQQFPDITENPPEIPPAIQIGAHGNLLFSSNDTNLAVAVADPEQLFEIAQTGQLYDALDVPATCYGEELQYIRTVANSTFKYAEVIKEAYDAGALSAEFPRTGLGEQLAVVARLIKGQLGTRLYKVSVDGFDTHANQQNQHPNLWRQISDAVSAFYQALAQAGMAQQVLSMTFSEFGRRIEENGSLGTDHGSSAPLFLFGPALNGAGFVGTPPDLRNPDPFGNLVFGTDFRQIYATLLEQWLCVPAPTVDALLGDAFERVDLGLSAATPIGGSLQQGFLHQARYQEAAGEVQIYFELPTRAAVSVQVLNAMGQPIRELFRGSLPAGSQAIPFAYRQEGLTPGHYYYRLSVGGQTYTRGMAIYR